MITHEIYIAFMILFSLTGLIIAVLNKNWNIDDRIHVTFFAILFSVLWPIILFLFLFCLPILLIFYILKYADKIHQKRKMENLNIGE